MLKAKQIRESKGLSILQVVRQVDVAPSNLSRFERGETNLGTKKLLELSIFYGVTINELLEEVEPAKAS